MTDAGRKALPKQHPYQVDKDVMNALKQAKAWTQLKSFLYYIKELEAIT